MKPLAQVCKVLENDQPLGLRLGFLQKLVEPEVRGAQAEESLVGSNT